MTWRIIAHVQSSPIMPPSSQNRPKRGRSSDRESSPVPGRAGPSNLHSSPPPSSLPPSSPPVPFSELGDEDVVGDDDEYEERQRGRQRDAGDDEEEDEGEDLFNDNLIKCVCYG